ncbi:Nif11-like leader peptide family natural product precursor [Nonomuraea sp. NPDC000554]|uniref:Nif11-like leader peptide family natural product precursor n=1 Tax=Nonomuraea sp. NPDC000554 TaxID=3154259 RepID=UPI0033328114
MSEAALGAFLRSLADRPELCDQLKDKPKDEVVKAAAELGHEFTEQEFNSLVWKMEERLAEHRGEQFDEHFSLWQLLWGKYYLEFLVFDLFPSLDRTGLLVRSEPNP